MRAFFHADFGKGLEAADTAVEELRRLVIQFTAQTTETVEGQQLFRTEINTVFGEQGNSLADSQRIQSGVYVIDTKAEFLSST